MVQYRFGVFHTQPRALTDLESALEEVGDPEMDHASMAARVMKVFEDDPDVPTQEGAVSEFIIREILHWEDEFRTMAGSPRSVRPS